MFTIDDIRNDPRFYIDERNLQRLFANGGGQKYEVVFVRIGSILRNIEERITTLYETDVYPYLLGKEQGRQRYINYCDKYPIMRKNEDTYKKLIREMASQEYDIHRGAIVVDEYNFILDGLHRSCITLYKHGPFFKVQVLKCHSGRHYGKKYRCKLLYYKSIAFMKCLFEYIKRLFH